MHFTLNGIKENAVSANKTRNDLSITEMLQLDTGNIFFSLVWFKIALKMTTRKESFD
jgi:hypothetical protein